MCAIVALRLRAKKPIAGNVAALLVAVMPPVVGNIIIIVSTSAPLSVVGMYLCFYGTDSIVLTLLWFTLCYCSIDDRRKISWIVPSAIVAVDVVQLALNPITGFAFGVRELVVEDALYYAPDAYFGLAFHRISGYIMIAAIAGIYLYKIVKSPRIYRERYVVILISVLIAALWQGFYVASGEPIDQSMVAFSVAALLIFYFALFYRPFRLLDSMLSRIVSNMSQAVFFFEDNTECIYANGAGYALLKLPKDIEIPPGTTDLLVNKLGPWRHKVGESWTDTRRIVEDGEECFYELQMQQVSDYEGRHIGAAFTVRDVTEAERKLQRERHQATHDALTDLYNERHLFECARTIIDENPDTPYVVVGMDIKEFKLVNDIFSKEYGDRVLCALADAMRAAATPGSAYGRIGSDKFGFIARADSFSADRVEQELLHFTFEGMDGNFPIIIHMGVYEVTEPDLAPDVMFDRAFMALASIKQEMNVRAACYTDEMRDRVLWSQTISSQLDYAIETGQIQPYLQPQVDAEGNIEGAEVLVRWIHPEEGFLSPARFIPVFEENGMIARLDTHMWECACRILREWQSRGIDYFLSVNISPKDFYFVDVFGTISQLVRRYGVDPAKLRLEITEAVMMSDLETRLQIIEKLRASGFLVEMDDFGSGYSSLNMLKDLPVDVLKIDMMFLYKTKNQDKAQTILEAIINLSSRLGIPSITEGVETVEQLSMLVEMGCRLFQGYYFAKPMPREEFEALIAGE